MKKRLVLLCACVFLLAPAALAKQSMHKSFEYLSPGPDAKMVIRETTIIVRPHLVLPPQHLEQSLRFAVSGSASGSHQGRIVAADDGRTVIFKPHRPFEYGERVSVTITADRMKTASLGADPFSFEFEITKTRSDDVEEDLHYPDCCLDVPGENPPLSKTKSVPRKPAVNGVKQGKFMLPPDFPPITITVNEDPEGGFIFAANTVSRNPDAGRYLMILDNTGFPQYFKKTEGNLNPYDFKKQRTGHLTYFLQGFGKFLAMDDSYTVVDTFQCGNGYSTDVHELQLLDNGHALLMSYDRQTVDMSEIVEGGQSDALVIGLIIQELDTSKNVVFQWRSWDHFEITDATNVDFTRRRIDYVHGNSIEEDFDGNLIISCRAMDEITKISRTTGEIVWRLGGKNNQFTFLDDPDHPDGFSRQHDARRLDNGHITLFDNGNGHEPPHSRGVEYELDMDNMTARLVWQYRDDPDRYSPSIGSCRRLPGGNTLVGWGRFNPFAVEVDPGGHKVWEIAFPDGHSCYRTFRYDWTGVAAVPTAWADTSSFPGELHLGFVRFGDESVDGYIIYRGDAPGAMTRMAKTPDNMIRVRNFEAGEMIYFLVTAVDARGNESFPSDTVAVAPLFSDTCMVYDAHVEIHPRTLNLKSNGQWISATIELPEQCGYAASDVLVGSVMLNGRVWAEPPGSPDGTGYNIKFNRTEVAAILPAGKSAEIKIAGRVGDDMFEGHDVIRVMQPGKATSEARPGGAPREVALTGNYPNPFNPATTITYTTPASDRVMLNIYDAQGRLVKTLVDGSKPEGSFTAIWNGRDNNGAPVASGVYFVRLQSVGRMQTRKIVFLK